MYERGPGDSTQLHNFPICRNLKSWHFSGQYFSLILGEGLKGFYVWLDKASGWNDLWKKRILELVLCTFARSIRIATR